MTGGAGWTVALAFDGALVEPDPPLRWRPNALQFVQAAIADGLRVILYTSRTNLGGIDSLQDAEDFYRSGTVPAAVDRAWVLHDEMRAFLQAHGLWPALEIWAGQGPPPADVIVDDRQAPPSFVALAARLGLPWVNGRRDAAEVGGPVSPVPGTEPGR